MKKIEITNNVYSQLSSRVKGFGDTPNDVIERLLKDSEEHNKREENPKQNAVDSLKKERSSVDEFILTSEYIQSAGVDRYLLILSFLHETSPVKFAELEFFRRRGSKRVNFASEKVKILNSGNSTNPKRIPNTSYYVLTNLDHRSKRAILKSIMPSFGFDYEEIKKITNGLADKKSSWEDLAL